MTTRVIRDGAGTRDQGWAGSTPEERIAAVWTLTRIACAWSGRYSGAHRFGELLSAFNTQGVEYLVVGAHALAAHGHVRATLDMDVWVRPSPENAARTMRALTAFGAPLHDLAEADLSRPGVVFQIGVAPVRIDVLTAIDGVDFADAWGERFRASLAGESVPVLSRKHLIQNKKASGRLQDLADVERLEGPAPDRT